MDGRELQTLVSISAIVGHVNDRQAGANEILENISRIIPYAAASLQSWNPAKGCHETVVNRGYSQRAVEHLDSWFVEHDEAFRFMQDVDTRPLRWQDMPFDYRALYSAQTHWLPAGYREGVTTCLFTPDGRYTGNLHINTESSRHPTAEAMSTLSALQPILSGFTDVMRMASWMAAALPEGASAVILDRIGGILDLPGVEPSSCLTSDGPLIAAAQHVVKERPGVTRFLWYDAKRKWHRVRLERSDIGVIVIEQPLELPYRLTARELDVLTLLSDGHSNAEIAAKLFVSVATAAKHVEHLFEKLECRSRASAAARALRGGLLRFPVGGPAGA